MFFIGIFGIDRRQKRIKPLKQLQCKGCNCEGLELYKEYSFFHLFFIPIIKWNIRYFAFCKNCGTVYDIKTEKAIKEESGQEGVITYWDINQPNYSGYQVSIKCNSCGKDLEDNYTYCPFCGSKRR